MSQDSISSRLDRLYEFERAPVTNDRLLGARHFAGLFAGEHVAATEFVIGALFVTWGASTPDILVGLLVGNLAAVLSWTFVCAPIAVHTRLTLYWYLRQVAGPAVTAIYNVLNALLYCILAGAMITVSASAVRIPFGIAPQTGWLPSDPRFILVVVCVGAVVTALAIWGFRRLADFSSACAPWMICMFVAGALCTLPGLGVVRSFDGFLTVANDSIWTGRGIEGQQQIGMWHVAAFAWICNIAMHLGLSDMAVLRFARKTWYGSFSAFGMFLGHYVAWICAGVMGAAAARAAGLPLSRLDAGAVAHHALGLTGAVAVVVAGWTTSNPTLYRAGLALQAVTPDWPRWKVTLVAGVTTTLIAWSPFVFTELLGFVGVYGMLLAPIGGIVTAEHWFLRRSRRTRVATGSTGRSIWNVPALVAWAVTVSACVVLWQSGAVQLFFLGVPAWLACGLLYTVLARQSEPAADGSTDAPTATPVPEPPPDSVRPRAPMRIGFVAFATLSLLICMGLAAWAFAAPEHQDTVHAVLPFASLAYFVVAILALRTRKQP